MPSIESLGHPLVFSVAHRSEVERDPPGRLTVRAEVRALDGMQKEALVRVGSGRTWRMVSDEGPYLNGADMAPFPLAFFSAGLQFALLSHLMSAARARSVPLRSVELVQDTFYTMEGSFLRGDATGGAMPARVDVVIEADAESDVIAGLVKAAAERSGPHTLMRDVTTSLFALTHNGVRCDVPGLPPSASTRTVAPDFEDVVPDPAHPCADDIITKIAEAERVHGVEGGAGSSLRAEQKRTLHIRGEARVTDGMAMATDIRLFKPIGSSFRFLCHETRGDGGIQRAPSPLAYLAAGVAFCYMTQLGRYAHIRQKKLASCSLVQRNAFVFAAADDGSTVDRAGVGVVRAEPFDTHVFMESAETDEAVRDFLRTGARTCFLHAAMRGTYPSDIRLRLNGTDLTFDSSVRDGASD